MHKLIILAVALFSLPGFAQSTPTDSQNLRALLDEVRQFRRDLQTTTATAERLQITLYRLQLQDAAVARATRRFEEARSRVDSLASEHKRVQSEIERSENAENQYQNPEERTVIEQQMVPRLKEHLQQIATDEEQWQAKATDAEGLLKAEQVKLESLNNVLDRLDRSLGSVGADSAHGAQSSR